MFAPRTPGPNSKIRPWAQRGSLGSSKRPRQRYQEALQRALLDAGEAALVEGNQDAAKSHALRVLDEDALNEQALAPRKAFLMRQVRRAVFNL
jgi:hypothetical protein